MLFQLIYKEVAKNANKEPAKGTTKSGVQKPNSVLTMYLNTDPSESDQQAGDWKIQLKNGMSSFENYLEQSGDAEELNNFKQVRRKVENFVYDNQLNFQKSIIVIASADESIWFTKILQMGVKTELFWQESPITNPLYQLHSAFPRVGIILVQQAKVKIIEAELGTILATHYYILDENEKAWQYNRLDKGSETDNTEVLDLGDFKMNQSRWYKRLAPRLDKLAKDGQWESIYIIGDKEEGKEIDYFMNKQVDQIMNRNLLDHKDTTIVHSIAA